MKTLTLTITEEHDKASKQEIRHSPRDQCCPIQQALRPIINISGFGVGGHHVYKYNSSYDDYLNFFGTLSKTAKSFIELYDNGGKIVYPVSVEVDINEVYLKTE